MVLETVAMWWMWAGFIGFVPAMPALERRPISPSPSPPVRTSFLLASRTGRAGAARP